MDAQLIAGTFAFEQDCRDLGPAERGEGSALDIGALVPAEAGDANGMYNLARLYETGDGGEKNPTEAMKWYQRAADGGNTDAAEQLRKLQARQRPENQP